MWRTLIVVSSVALGSTGAVAQGTVKIGLILPRVEKVNGKLWNVELATAENVKDPVKAARK
jgi:hypothetical protein